MSRLNQLGQDFAGTAHDLTLSFSHNPAAQIASSTRSNDAFAYTGRVNANVTDMINGLNQVTATGPTSVTHDARGNTTAIGNALYAYTSENRLAGAYNALGTILLPYWPNGELAQVYRSAQDQVAFEHAQGNIIAERDGGSWAMLRRYVHAPGALAEPLVWYEGSGASDRRFLHADERGSIVAVSNSSGAVTNVNSYDDYGRPASGNAGRFQYTGQPWLAEIGLYYLRNRMFNPDTGRFMQTDPIGYGAGMNPYSYVGGNPINFTDPSGLDKKGPQVPEPTCTGTRIRGGCGAGGIASGLSGLSTGGVGGHVPTGEASLNALGVNTSGMSGAEMRALAGQFLQFAEWLAVSGLPRDATYRWGVSDGQFIASFSLAQEIHLPPGMAEGYRDAFLSAQFVGSAQSGDPDHAIARNPILRQNAVTNGTMFYISSERYLLPSVLLQAEVSIGRVGGVVEYIMPQDWNFFFGTPIINHARFVRGAPISGYPNNDRGRYPPFGSI